MIRFTTGDILAEDAEALVNTVNCVGVMGRGIALQFKKAFPENFRAYADGLPRAARSSPAECSCSRRGALTNPRYIINFPTKRHWRGNSRIEDIDAGLKDLVTVIRERDIRSIAVPPLGSRSRRPRMERGAPAHREGVARLQRPGMSSYSSRGGRRRRSEWCSSREVPRMSSRNGQCWSG